MHSTHFQAFSFFSFYLLQMTENLSEYCSCPEKANVESEQLRLPLHLEQLSKFG